MPTTRKRVGRAGGGAVTQRARELYRRGVAAGYWERIAIDKELVAELGVDLCLPSLLHDTPVFLIAVLDEAPYRETWAALKAELEVQR